MPTFEQQLHIAVQHFTAGRMDMAWSAGEGLLKLFPRHAGVLQLLGEIAWHQGDNKAAEDLFNRAVVCVPRDPQAHYRLGNALFARRQLDGAEKHYRQSLRFKPDYWPARVNLGLLLRSANRLQESREQFGQVLEQRPDHTVVFCYLLDLLLSLGELKTVSEMSPKIQAVVNRCIENDNERDFAALIYLSPLVSVSGQDYDALCGKMESLLHKPGADQLSRDDRPDQKKLRIGYVSADFGDHPISHVMLGVFGQHDRERFEIIAYSISTRTGAADRKYVDIIRQSCDEYVDLSVFTPHRAAERIAADGVAVLVNLSGYMSPQSLEIFSWRPSPVQVYWLGHGGGLGLSFFDYMIADSVVVPPGEERRYREKVVRMPDSYHCTDTPYISDTKQTRAEYGLDENAFVFCAFNNPNKINSDVFDVWMNILRRVSGSQLWLSNPAGDSVLERNLRNEALRRDIDVNRLIFAVRVADKSLHFARHRLADLFLDTFVYNASTTAIDALWAGLPVLTRPGKDFFSRICASHVTNVGLGDMICASSQEYEERAIYFANNLAELAAIRDRLVQCIDNEPLFDLPRFVGYLEQAYQQMWELYCLGERPESFDISAIQKAVSQA